MQWNEKVFSTTLGCGRSSVERRQLASKWFWQTSDKSRGGVYTLFTVVVGRSTDDTVGPWKEHFEDLLKVWGVDLPVTELKSLTYLATPGPCHCATVWDAPLQYYMCLSCRTGRRVVTLLKKGVCSNCRGGKEKKRFHTSQPTWAGLCQSTYFRSCTNKASYCRQ